MDADLPLALAVLLDSDLALPRGFLILEDEQRMVLASDWIVRPVARHETRALANVWNDPLSQFL